MKLTPESFLNVVKKSGLIEPDRLKRLLLEYREQGSAFSDSSAIAQALIDSGTLTSWQAEKLLKGKHRGFFLGKYRLLSLLGKGGMSSVYLAEHVLMRRRCAVKVLPTKRVNDSSYLGRFHREAQAVAALDHPNIVRAYDVDVDDRVERGSQIHFLVMEYVAGESMQELVEKNGTIDFVSAVDWTRQAADGLVHAHQAGMVHRDIKPANLLVDKNDVVKILDLGLARFFQEGEEESLTVTHDEKVLGTADYLAPEQALDSHNVDARADIYSLGCTLYYLLTGHPPFTEGTLAQRLMAHQTKEPPRIEEKRPDIPLPLADLIRKMMAKSVDDRCQSAAEVSESMTAWLLEHAGEDWRQRNPALVGEGSGIVGSSPDANRLPVESTSASGSSLNQDTSFPDASKPFARRAAAVSTPTDNVPQEQVAVDDGNLASFLSNLDTGEKESEKQPVPEITAAKSETTAKPEQGRGKQIPQAVPANPIPVAATVKTPATEVRVAAAVAAPVETAATVPLAKVAKPVSATTPGGPGPLPVVAVTDPAAAANSIPQIQTEVGGVPASAPKQMQRDGGLLQRL
ncbi:MAG: protein kinase, partial [Planctomycetes bacterium]|nr:protein kinase [Planctomycetota bacterium]